jgi:DNA (cytosine-5)-methyltransferase 1
MDSNLSADAQSAVLSSIRRPDFAWDLADLERVPKNGIKVFSTFACGGGSTMGYKLAGCDVIGANDIDAEMAWHYKINHSPKHYFLCPIRDLLTKDLPKELFNLDILDGSPPCSTFSTAGKRDKTWGKEKHFREGQATQILSDLFFDFLDLAERLKPRTIIAENVKGMILGNAKGYCKMVMQRLRDIGYRPQVLLINAADCGVPQRRERVFFCAVREDISNASLELKPSNRWISAHEAIKDLKSLTIEEKEQTKFTSNTDKTWWKKTRPGEDYKAAVLREGLPPKFWNSKKIDPNLPSLTLPATEMILHWKEPRYFTFREWKRLGSFPDDYVARNDKIGKYLIGMSVPPKMMEVVARAVCSQWLGVPDHGVSHE